MRRAPMFGVVWLVLFTARCRSSPQGKNRLAHLFNYTKIAAHLLSEVESRGSNLSAYEMSALWDFMTDIRPSTKNAVVLASTLVKEFTLSTSRNASAIKELDLPRDVARQIRILRRNSQPNDQADVARLQSLITNMTEIYSTGKVCLNITRNNTCMSLDPDLGNLMSRSRNQDELVWAWRGWRDAVAPPVRGMFQQMVDLLNKGARQHGLGDYGHFERGEYEMGNDFTAVIKKLWTDVKPLYKELHAYVRFQLKKKYAGMSGSGPIPAHLLGNMWAQNWDGIYDMVQPYPDATPLDVTPSLIKQHYTPEKMFKLAQSFFVSIGLDPMPKSFWNKSMLRKPGNKSVVCHASAFDFLKDDVRCV
ncbi:angiotensin-converting enzyme [Nematostella vectensis]|uniref:angiotensin-converting enzyme n=1 Tax=Nematostella vectensis TaxID=45351 RepID=UPI002076F547|nr:angiotensin-converting enzyme [Nematostella vectensis]